MDLDSLMRGLGPLQDTMKKSEAERASVTFEGSAGGGAVKVKLKGDLTVGGIAIAPAAATAAGGDVGMLEDLVMAACNDALRQYKSRYGASPDEQIQKMLGGADLSALMGPLMRGLGK